MGNFFGPWWDKEVEKTKQWRKDKKKKAQERNNKTKKVVFDKKVNKIWNEIEKTDSKKDNKSKKTIKTTNNSKNNGYGGKTGMTEAPGNNTGGMQKALNLSMKKALDNTSKSKVPANLKKGASVFKPTDMTGSMFGRSKLNRPSGQEVPGQRAVKDKAPVTPSMYGNANQGNIGNSESTSPKPNYKKAVQADTKKKKKRAQGRNQMRNARASMGIKY